MIRFCGEQNHYFTQRELRNDSGAILREVQAGEAVIVTRNGVPVAELRAVPQRRFVSRAVIAEAARHAPFGRWRTSARRTGRRCGSVRRWLSQPTGFWIGTYVGF